MFITGWANNNYFQRALTVTFSEMLENLSELKIIYWVWYGFYVIITLRVIHLVSIHDIYCLRLLDIYYEYHKTHHFCATEAVHIFTIFYIICSLVKLIGLAMVPVYDVSNSATSFLHAVAACMAFIGALLAALFLFIRRTLVFVYYTNPDSKYVVLSKWHLFILNLIWIFIGIGIIIAFAVNVYQDTGGGLWEFFLCMFLVSDILWQIVDFGNDVDPILNSKLNAENTEELIKKKDLNSKYTIS
jgi:hypothetical protein